MSNSRYKNCDIRNPLSCFELYDNKDKHLFDRFFLVVVVASLFIAIAVGKYFQTVEPREQNRVLRRAEQLTAQFIINQPEPEPEPEKVEEVKKPDSEQPQPLEQPKVVEEAEPLPQEVTSQDQEPQQRVFGLERVHSSGLGAGGAMRDAVVGRIGNTLNAPINDTAANVVSEGVSVQGEIATVATITSKPSIITMVKPEYTQEMIENEVEGVVRVRVLVDIDGKVKDVEVLDELGHGASEAIIEASYKMRFAPAMRDGQPVAVWIIIRFNLVLA